MADDPLARVFNETHMTAIILYIRDHPGCGKTDIVRDTVRNGRLPDKIRILRDTGVVESLDRGNNREVLRLTPKGERIAGLLDDIRGVLSE